MEEEEFNLKEWLGKKDFRNGAVAIGFIISMCLGIIFNNIIN